MRYRLTTVLLLLFFLATCSGPSYYLQAVSGHWKMMHSRQDISTLLDDPATSTDLATQLQAANQIRAFAQSVLDLPGNESYTSYVEVEGDALVWNVVATGEFSLQPKQWCFLVAGCVPYRGFFKQQRAERSATSLRDQGMDVLVSPAAAYSSLGWFKDPLLSTMLSGSDIRLAAYLFHELAHQRLYIKDDSSFNEGYASFVQKAGIKAWLESQQRQDDLLRWQQLQGARKDFAELIGGARKQLAAVYLSDQADAVKREIKADVFATLSNSYERISVEKWQGHRYYDSWFEPPLNNAKLALYTTYASGLCAFQGLLDRAENNFQEFHRLAEQKARLPKAERKIWLQQRCSTIAPQHNL